MPSAANCKVDKQITSESALVDSASSNQQNTPLRQALVIIEHKIRNLEKRKTKLESYRELQRSGKELNQDQRVAVAKYDEVVQTLEFARDLCKQFQGITVVADKEAKKQSRKEAVARNQQELAKIREVLLVQDALTQLGNETVREDFLLGRNGAATLTEGDLKLMDDLYTEVTPKHEPGSSVDFMSQVQTAAEHLMAVADGKPKEAFGSTYTHVKEIITKIHESGYFDQAVVENGPEFSEEPQEQPVTIVEESEPEPAGTFEGAGDAAAEPQFFQQARPISEVLGTPPFYFLQESELDSPEQTPVAPAVLNAAAIPTQTFTNQNFVNMTPVPVPVPATAPASQALGFVAAPPNPPPPIPMPPSHVPFEEARNGPSTDEPKHDEQPSPRRQPRAGQRRNPPNAHFSAPASTYYQNNGYGRQRGGAAGRGSHSKPPKQH